jgi:hypothetical protein
MSGTGGQRRAGDSPLVCDGAGQLVMFCNLGVWKIMLGGQLHAPGWGLDIIW